MALTCPRLEFIANQKLALHRLTTCLVPPREADSADATLNPRASRKLQGNQPCQADLSVYLIFFLSLGGSS